MRKMNLGVSLAFAVGVCSVGRSAGAQATPPAPPPSPAPPAAAPPAPATPAPAAAPPAATPDPTPVAAADPAPAPAASEPGQTMPAEAVPAPPTAAEPAAHALEEHAKSPAPEIGGHVEAAYHLNLTNPNATDAVVLRSYDGPSGHSFLLHTAHLVLKHSFTDAVSAVIEIDGGTDAAITNGLGIFDVQEAYATYKTDFGLSFTAGKFVTYEGIEVIEGPMNPTVTRGFLFGLAEPYTHIGAKVHYAIGDMADIGVGVVNGWDLYVDNNDAKTFMGRLGLTPVKQFWAGISAYYGAERADSNDDRRLSLDLTGAVIPSDMITVNFQANYGSEPDVPLPAPATGTVDGSWFGFGLQPVLKVDAFSAGLRFEYFSDKDGTRTGAPGTDINVWNLSLTPGYTVEGWMIRAEYRFDSANEPIFNGGSGDTEDQQHTIAAAVSYMF